MDGAPARGRNKSSTEGALEQRFEADEWGRLTVEQRLRRCHLMAQEARELAKTAPTEIAETYLQIAKDWLQLATEMQKAAPSAASKEDHAVSPPLKTNSVNRFQ